MTWWQVFIVFWVYGIGARVDDRLSQDRDFKHGVGLAMRIFVWAGFTVGAWLLVSTWAGITW
jgi:hypothetical protein